jgi:hypothetical protein
MIIILLIVMMLGSFALHLYFLTQYVQGKENRHLKGFINTAISNIVVAGVMMIVVLFRPEFLREINLQLVLWLVSGAIMLMMLFIKATIVRNIIKRAKDPAHYHYNFFGKKVLDSSAVTQNEVMIFWFTIPFFLLAGAYFVTRLINMLSK